MARAPQMSLLAVLPVIGCLAVFCFASPHDVAAFTQARGGIIGGVIGDAKRADDEAEVSEIREQRPQTRADGEEAREQTEASAYQTALSGEHEEP